MAEPAYAPTISIAGNVTGNIIQGDNNLVVNTNYGTIIQKMAPPAVQLRGMASRPPRPLSYFTGRAVELEQIDRSISARQVLLLAGADGIGKTALARQAANRPAAASLPNGVLFLEGQDGQLPLSMGDLAQQMFEALFESDPPRKVTLPEARTYLSNTAPLVLLDGFPFSAGDLTTVGDLFPQSAILVTTGQAARAGDAEVLRLGPLPRRQALDLLAARAGIQAGETEHPALNAICALLADVPLAIFHCAQAIQEYGLGLEAAREALESFTPSAPGAVEAAIERAYALSVGQLSPQEQQALALVAAAPGLALDRDWLEGLLGAPEASARLEALALLQANSPRLRLSPGLRALALAGFDQAGLKTQLLDRWLALLSASPQPDLDLVAAERDNLAGLLEWAAGQQRWPQVLALGRAMDPYLTLSGLWDAWERCLEHVLRAARASHDPAAEAWALHQLGTRLAALDEPAQAVPYLRRALKLRSKLGDEAGMAYTRHNLGLLLPDSKPPGNGKPPGRFGWLNLNLLLVILLIACTSLFAGTSYGQAIIGRIAPIRPPFALPTSEVGGGTVLIPVSGATESPLLPPGKAPPVDAKLTPEEDLPVEQPPAITDDSGNLPGPTATWTTASGGIATTTQVSINLLAQTSTPTPSQTPTNTPTGTLSLTPTGTLTRTPTRTPTGTLTRTPTVTPTRTPTTTPSSTATQTAGIAPSHTPTHTPVSSFTPTSTLVATSTATNTPVPSLTPTATFVPTSTPTSSPPPPPPDLDPPPAPVPLDPVGAYLSCTYDVDLVWSAVSDPSGISYYEWELDYYSGYDYYPEDSGQESGTEANVGVYCGDSYRWRVRAVDGSGNIGPFSGYAYFDVDS